nr:MAG TPA: hypothetical protein [Caudoviricetes sp.]
MSISARQNISLLRINISHRMCQRTSCQRYT